MTIPDIHQRLTCDTSTLASCDACGRSLLSILQTTGKARCRCGDWIEATA